MKKNTTIAAAVATMLIAGGAVLAGEGVDIDQNDPAGNGNWSAQGPLQLGADVDQNDPAGNGNWSAQGPLQLGADVDQNDPYGNGNWSAQGPLQLGADVDQNDPAGNGNWRAQPTQQLNNREAARLVRLCSSRMIRLVFEARGIELDCP